MVCGFSNKRAVPSYCGKDDMGGEMEAGYILIVLSMCKITL